MARPSRNAIEMFADKLEHMPKWMVDANGNDNYVPKENFMEDWTPIPTKMEDGQFALWFTYELLTTPNQPDQWVQVKTWDI